MTRFLKNVTSLEIVINPDNPLGNLTSIPLCKRGRACEGAEGDFCVPATLTAP